MASVVASNKLLFLNESSYSCRRKIEATVNLPKVMITTPISLPNLSTTALEEELYESSGYEMQKPNNYKDHLRTESSSDPTAITKLYAIMEAVADRVEMHDNIGKQRDNWNRLLLTSINTISLTAATMSGLAATAAGGGVAAFKVSSTILYLAATGMLAILNTLQPSQLAEEQRNAARLFKQHYGQIQTLISIGNPHSSDVNVAMESVLALDRAYPLPLLGAMLEKFPGTVKPAVWWPQQMQKQELKVNNNGWNSNLEDEMREIVRVLKMKDMADYLRLGEVALKLNKMLAIAGPVLTLIGALGSAFVGRNPWMVMIGVGGGAMASIVNSMEHGGQVGMVFEMYRSNAGYFKLMEERIESNVNEKDVKRRENGEILELKVALQLGRRLSDLKNLAASSSSRNEEFASKLF